MYLQIYLHPSLQIYLQDLKKQAKKYLYFMFHVEQWVLSPLCSAQLFHVEQLVFK